MWSYTLLFVLQIFSFAPTVSGDVSVTAKLHHPVTLTCNSRCSGVLKWIKFHKPGSVLARCDQTSCRSEEGFNISHDQYLKGNPHLTITAADYSARRLYTCLCDNKVVCNVRLLIEPLEMTHVIAPGEPIEVFLPHTDLVDVSFTASDAVQPSNLQICSVDKEKIQCSPDYKERASLLNTLQIKDGDVSDCGNYTVQDIVNDETLAIVTVHVREPSPDIKPCPDIKQQEGVPVWGIVLILMVLLLVSVLVVVSVMYVRLRREVHQLRENAENSRLALLQQNGNGNHPGEESNLKNP
ncbi:uncharacterized protein LOC108255580 [Ictalurus punctatus]|uniref:Uncharacterized protein LOC108255580 n=1 Tax=Ictalurus punctatus TaxID=7998 RepID=A0A2D0PM83_ICTPU|nr:uncharacterized protein LOC108255580 [Ictalurus punctatus]